MILDRCVTCKRVQALPLRGPPPPDLPSFRMSFDFSNTGIDFAGPLYVRDIYGDSNTMYKSYICQFTCATTRNIHLELTPDMTTHSLINSLERFLSRRGCINMFISDNFTTFKSGDLLNFLKDNEIKWKYILPLSPWWGGFYMRLVRIVKTTLRKILGSARLHFEELSTILTKVEAMINSRPLSYLYDDDPETAITPSHLSIGRNIYSNKPTVEVINETFSISQTEASKRIQYIEKVLQTYWTRFKKEYLNELREHQIYDRRKYKANILQINDIVLIKDDDNLPRNRWKKGLITELVKGNDKHIRGAVIKLCKNGKISYIKRDIKRLIPMELGNEVVVTETPRNKRTAALNADILRKLNTN